MSTSKILKNDFNRYQRQMKLCNELDFLEDYELGLTEVTFQHYGKSGVSDDWEHPEAVAVFGGYVFSNSYGNAYRVEVPIKNLPKEFDSSKSFLLKELDIQRASIVSGLGEGFNEQLHVIYY